MHDFNLVPFVERGLFVTGMGHHLKIERHGNMGTRDLQLLEHLGDGPAGLQFFLLAVDDELHNHLGEA